MRIGVVTLLCPPHAVGESEISVKLLVDDAMGRQKIANVKIYSLHHGYPSQLDGVTINMDYPSTKNMAISNIITSHCIFSELGEIVILAQDWFYEWLNKKFHYAESVGYIGKYRRITSQVELLGYATTK